MSEKRNIIQGYINQCENTQNPKDAEKLIEEIISVFSEEIKGLTQGLDTRNPVHVYEGLNGENVTYDFLGDLRILKQKLKMHMASLSDTPSHHPNQVINVNTNVSLTITLEQVISKIDETSLAEKEKEALKEQLAILSTRKGNREKIWEISKDILKWLADKSVDVGIAALPYIISLLS